VRDTDVFIEIKNIITESGHGKKKLILYSLKCLIDWYTNFLYICGVQLKTVPTAKVYTNENDTVFNNTNIK